MQQETITAHDIHSKDWKDIAKIGEQDLNIAVLQRMPEKSIEDFVEKLSGESLQDFFLSVTPQNVRQHLQQQLSIYRELNPTGFTALLDDITYLTHQFASLTTTRHFRLYFARVTHDMCRRFHTDINYLRMICTYHGPGTQWIVRDNIHLAHPSGDFGEDIIPDVSRIQQLKTFEVGILKGALYPDNVPTVLHRSPPVIKDNKRRIMLRIDMSDS